MFICYYDDTILGNAKTEKEAQEICYKIGSSYMKLKPFFLFWMNKKSLKKCTYNTTLGFLTYKEVMNSVLRIAKENFNKAKELDFNALMFIFEKLFGDCSEVLIKKFHQPI